MKTPVKIVKVDSFCNGKYEILVIDNNDYINLKSIRERFKVKYKVTIDKYIDYHTINQKEFKRCL